MAYPTVDTLMGLGVAPELAAIIDGSDPAPAIDDLAGLGMPIEQAAVLGAVAYGSRPTKATLIGLGMKPELAEVLGQ